MLRQCRKCGVEYPLDKSNFGHQPNGGFRYTCRACVRKNVKGHYWNDPQRHIERALQRSHTVLTEAERVKIKRQLVLRDGGFVCFYCKQDLDDAYHIDHMNPVAKGGSSELANYALSCHQCNQEKHSKDLDEYRAWLRKNGEAVLF